MPRASSALFVAALATLLLAACTSAPAASAPSDSATSTPSAPAGGVGASVFPGCDDVATALGDLLSGLSYDEALSTAQTAPEAYDQRVCVFTTADAAARVGVTLASIAFLDTELEVYGSAPTALADERLSEHGAVLQTLKAGDSDDGHLDSALYLFDAQYSITIQGYAKDGSATTASLPGLTVAAATDAAFAVRALID